MKILALTNLYPPHHIGGYELICQTVLELLRERGHDLRILTSDYRVPSASCQPEDAWVERSLKINGLYGHRWRGIRELRGVEKHNNAVLRAALARNRPDLVSVWNMGGLSKSMLFTLQGIGIPTVFYISDHWIVRGLPSDVWLRWWNESGGPLNRRLFRYLWKLTGAQRRWQAKAPTNPVRQARFQRICFCSRALRDEAAAAGWDVSHAAVIHAPVHPRYLNGEPQSLRPSVSRLLYAGRLAADKGVMTALRALSLLRGKLDAQLSVYGRGDPDYVAGLERFASDRRLNVHFDSAALEQMPRVYRDHDLLLFTSEWAEPFALTPIEAMACGLPVVATATGGSAELFRDGENSLVYPAGSAEQLAQCIWEFATDDALRTRCARAGCAEARQRCAAPVIVDQFEEYLRESLRDWRPAVLPHYA